MVKFSIVISAHNFKNYAEEAIKLILKSNVEIILLDTAHSDRHTPIYKELQDKYPKNIKYILKNKISKNELLNLITGEWITFIDSDDLTDLICLTNINSISLDDNIESNNVDLIAAKLNLSVETKEILQKDRTARFYNKKGYIDLFFPSCNFKEFSLTSLFYKKEIINQNFSNINSLKRIFHNAKKIMVITNSICLYKDITDNSIWNKKDSYTKEIIFGNLAIKNFYKKYIYPASWLYKTKNLFPYKKKKLIKQYKKIILRKEFNLGLLKLFYNKQEVNHNINITKYNVEKDYIKAHICSSTDKINLEFFSSDKKLQIRTHKIKYIKLYDTEFYYEHILYIDLSQIENTQEISSSLDGKPIKLHWHINWKRVSAPNKDKIKEMIFPSCISLNFISYLSKIPYFKNKYKDSWVLIDRDIRADDNAEHFYRYLRDNTKENIFFCIRKNLRDYKRLKQESFNLLPFGGLQHKIALLNCKYLISSNADSYIHSFLKSKSLKQQQKFKFVFLQHGIIKDDLSKWLNKEPIDVFITSTQKEYNSIVLDGNNYDYSKEEVILTGLPRHDALLQKAKNYHSNKKAIVIMPTWRSSLAGSRAKNSNSRTFRKSTLNSDYIKKWTSFLQSKELSKIKEQNNLEVIFLPHDNAEIYMKQFKNFTGITYYDSTSNISLQDLFVCSSIFITDYSSVAFEAAYLLKNIIYYQFDKEEIFSGKHAHAKGYFSYDKDGFGGVCLEEYQLINSIQETIDNNFVVKGNYLNKMKNEFSFRDGKCSERIYNYLIGRSN
ncbi:MAG: bifunctional glycosyltransferase family 2 protein/CDP-glycerol:glycerophosphate glycerophosphotransferase [Alphaproteobacteria bacterium]|nr:bifunctional glycosyltransferase family 2 protein/CDP-glycerol:glycerophosphate glycerophosphotransferase [Alphaproteobacteria bacterium]